MDKNFTHFSEAAKVYAKYSSVVDQMYAAFQNDITSFLDQVLDRAKANAKGANVLQDGNMSRSWYIWQEGWPEEWYVPYLWIDGADPQIVKSGILTLEVRAEGTLKPYQDQLRSVLSAIPLPKNCSRANGSGGLLLRVTISVNEGEDMVPAAAEPIWTLLTAMDDEFRKIQKVSTGADLADARKVR